MKDLKVIVTYGRDLSRVTLSSETRGAKTIICFHGNENKERLAETYGRELAGIIDCPVEIRDQRL